MARKTRQASSVDFSTPAAEIIDVPLADEMSGSFLEYAYSVVSGRALPDVRDGLKPVHRRILYTMNEMGLRPDRAFVKVAKVSGNCMGLYHPHGDSAINDALVRLAQDFAMGSVLVDGHGNFGSLDSGAAAARYIEARLAPLATHLLASVDEDTVDMKPNYDGSLLEPSVLPAAFPNLLVNGSEGIAVGMATKMPPHNLSEVIAATRLVLKKPQASVDDILAVMPGPDFPGGCQVLGTEGIREAYETGKGVVRMRALTRTEIVEGSRGRQQIIVSALPYMVGPERVIEAIKKGISDKKITFVSDVIDLSEGDQMALHIELKSGVNPDKALNTLFALTPMESSFSIANLALVDGQPKLLGVRDIITEFLTFRRQVVLRRSEFRRAKALARLHLVDGLLIALDLIEEVVKTIRSSKTTSDAKSALMKKFGLSELQSAHVLEMPLRRLTSLEVTGLQKEKKELEATVADLTDIIENPKRLTKVIDSELVEVDVTAGAPRLSTISDASAPAVELTAAPATNPGGATPVDDLVPVTWHLTAKGLLTTQPKRGDRSIAAATTSSDLLLLCEDGVAVRVPAELPEGAKAAVIANRSVPVVGIANSSGPIAVGTVRGVVKVVRPDWPVRGDEFPYVGLEPADRVVWAGLVTEGDDLMFVTSDAQLLRFPASSVRPQGRSGGGMAGVRLKDQATVVAFAATNPTTHVVVTESSSGRAKTTPVGDYPAKGRGGAGVRCHALLKGDTGLADAYLTEPNASGLPPAGKRDGSGVHVS